MKRSVKILCIVAGGLVCLGLIIGALGRAFKGTFNVGIFNVGSFNTGFVGMTVTEADILTETKELLPFNELEIQASLTDVIINKGDKYSLEISAPEELMPEVSEENGKLIIKQPKVSSISLVGGKIFYKLSVPSDDVIDAHIDLSSGDISVNDVNVKGTLSQSSGNLKMSGVRSDYLNLSSSSGEAELGDCMVKDINIEHTSGDIVLGCVGADKISVKSTSGDISFDAVVAEDELSAEITSGDIEGKDCSFKNVSINGTSTEVKLGLRGSVSDYDYSIDSNTGDIKVDTMEMERSYKTNSGADRKIVVDTTSGDVEITF